MRAACLILVLGTLLAGCERQLPDIDPLSGGSPRAGKLLIERYGCAACHQIKGIANADSQVGPSLKEIRGSGYVGGVMPNSAGNLVKWIMDPREVDPKTAMPDLGVSEAEARDIAAYLYNQ
jgi:cytochrome c